MTLLFGNANAVTQMCLPLRLAARHYGLIAGTGRKPRAPSDTGTGACWAASEWNTPLAAQWADSRIAWREGNAGRKLGRKP